MSVRASNTSGPRPGVAASLLLLLAAEAPASDDKVTAAHLNLERKPVNTVIPAYPEKARRDRVEGDVLVCYHIDRGGKPRGIGVRRSSHRVFERPAIRAVKQSRYAPLAPEQAPSPAKTCRTFRFRLNPADNQGSSA
ncbi:MAG: energy transducer TonB [Pseudomonadota bacterium]